MAYRQGKQVDGFVDVRAHPMRTEHLPRVLLDQDLEAADRLGGLPGRAMIGLRQTAASPRRALDSLEILPADEPRAIPHRLAPCRPGFAAV